MIFFFFTLMIRNLVKLSLKFHHLYGSLIKCEGVSSETSEHSTRTKVAKVSLVAVIPWSSWSRRNLLDGGQLSLNGVELSLGPRRKWSGGCMAGRSEGVTCTALTGISSPRDRESQGRPHASRSEETRPARR